LKAAEKQAAENYESSEKRTLSGQLFVATKGAVNFKLGAVQVALFARDAIDVLVAGLKTFADAKIEQLQPPLDTAETAQEQAEAIEEQAQATLEQAKSKKKILGSIINNRSLVTRRDMLRRRQRKLQIRQVKL
jgi:hypothetical protein